MTITRRRFISITAGLAGATVLPGAGFAGRDGIARWSGTALGAKASLAIAGRSGTQADSLIRAAVAEIARMENLFSLYRAQSTLARLNRDGKLDHPPADMLRLLGLCAAVNRLTVGRFDPTVQPVWALMARTAGKPAAADLVAAYQRTGWHNVHYDTRRIAFARPGMALTFNGIAQGYVTDRVADLLRAAGLANVLVEIGEIAALGERTPGQPWRVGIAERGDAEPEDTVDLTDRAIATSAPLGTVFDAAGTAGHIIAATPERAGVPAQWRRISVIHASAGLADGLSTGLCLMARAEVERFAEDYREARIIAV